MKFNIKPYKVEHETIPTKLRLMVEDTDITINYYRSDKGWEFSIYNITSAEQAQAIIDQITSMMCAQSYDHGQEWRVSEVIQNRCEINNLFKVAEFTVVFRIKDSY